MLERLMGLLGYAKIPRNIPPGYHLVPAHIAKNSGRKAGSRYAPGGDAAPAGDTTSFDSAGEGVDTSPAGVKPLPGQTSFLDD